MKKRKFTYRYFQYLTIICGLVLAILLGTNVEFVHPITHMIYKTNTPTKKKTTPKVEKKPTYEVTFSAVGDNLIHDNILKVSKKNDNTYDFNPLYENVKDDLKNSDLSFINQETILGGKKASGYPRFNTPDSMTDSLEYMGIDIVNGATNHALDQGNSGVYHQVELFKKLNKMTLVGLYNSREDYNKISVVEKNGIKFAFLAYTYGSNRPSNNSYTVKQFDDTLIKKEVAQAKQLADFVIVSAHWGTEYDSTTNIFEDTYAQELANLGVDVVIGTHPHVIQKMSWLSNNQGHKTLVAYSLGNFVSTQSRKESLLGGMLSLKFSKKDNQKEVSQVKWIPIMTHIEAPGNKVNLVKVYKVKDYTDELAKKHWLNRRRLQITKDSYVTKTKQLIRNFEIEV